MEHQILLIGVASTLVLLVEGNCPDGYNSVAQDLHGIGKDWSQPKTDPNRNLQQCADICSARSGCTSFEYANGPTDNGACATYTGGDSNIHEDQNRTHPSSNWFSCIKVPGDEDPLNI